MITENCADGSPHVFLKDGGTSPSGTSCAICDQDYREWLLALHPEDVDRMLPKEDP